MPALYLNFSAGRNPLKHSYHAPAYHGAYLSKMPEIRRGHTEVMAVEGIYQRWFVIRYTLHTDSHLKRNSHSPSSKVILEVGPTVVRLQVLIENHAPHHEMTDFTIHGKHSIG